MKSTYLQTVGYEVLGPVRVLGEGNELSLGGPQQRLVLALLIAADGQTTSTDQLIEGVWGEDPPSSARKTLQGYIHHLRSEVGDALRTEGGPDEAVSQHAGRIRSSSPVRLLDREPRRGVALRQRRLD